MTNTTRREPSGRGMDERNDNFYYSTRQKNQVRVPPPSDRPTLLRMNFRNGFQRTRLEQIDSFGSSRRLVETRIGALKEKKEMSLDVPWRWSSRLLFRESQKKHSTAIHRRTNGRVSIFIGESLRTSWGPIKSCREAVFQWTWNLLVQTRQERVSYAMRVYSESNSQGPQQDTTSLL